MVQKHFNVIIVNKTEKVKENKCIVRVMDGHLDEFKKAMLEIDSECMKDFKDLKYESPPEYTFKDWWDIPEFDAVCDDYKWGMCDVYVKDKKTISSIQNMVNTQAKSFWYPFYPNFHEGNKVWTTTEKHIPKYPIYVISLGRWKKHQRLTSNSLEEIGVPYHLVVEEQEKQNYIDNGVKEDTILTLPKELCQLGQGSIPVRNWIWDHSMENGHKRHWVMDDNIDGFYRFHKCTRWKVMTGLPLCLVENVVDRYQDIYLSGLNYRFFAPNTDVRRQRVQMNTRVYSCILIQNDCPIRWRGRYNEDTDLSLRVMKAGYTTLVFNNFLCGKKATNTMKGGNTSSIYQEQDGMLKKANSLQEQHPDVVKVSDKKFVGKKSHHHVVDYKPFKKNKLVCVNEPENKNINNYGLTLVDV
jgi:hypothetical protein